MNIQKQMQELEGALKICEIMQKKEETMVTLDENYYWEVIHEEEQAGNKFFEILSDVANFEKKVIFDEFGIGDENGKLKYSPMKAVNIIKRIGMFVAVAVLIIVIILMVLEGF